MTKEEVLSKVADAHRAVDEAIMALKSSLSDLNNAMSILEEIPEEVSELTEAGE